MQETLNSKNSAAATSGRVIIYIHVYKFIYKGGRAQVTLPLLLFNEFNVYKQEERAKRGCKSNYRQEITNALGSLQKLAQDRLEWAHVVRNVCELGALVKSLKQKGQNQEE